VSKRFLVPFLLLLLVLFSGTDWQSSLAQSGGEQYFKETRHWVKGEFLTKYNSVPNPLNLYGYPITPAFLDPTTSQLVQYFQKARFDLNHEAPEGQRVQVSPLGRFVYEPGQPVTNLGPSPTCREFETGHSVCFAFIKFFDENGGEAQFGPPISDLEYHNGLIVQYFDNARFEWRPDYPSGNRVLLGNLGIEHFYQIGADPSLLKPELTDFTIEANQKNILSLKVRAYPLRAVTSRSGSQTIFIVVQDQSLVPVEGVQLTLAVLSTSGKESRYIVRQRTNSAGMSQFSFPFAMDSVGIVQVTVTATRENLEAKTTTSFRAWW
jgi:hypothetical protein